MTGSREKDDGEESRRILRRVTEDADGSALLRAGHRLERHIRAADVEAEDRIELWGTRIGRALALLACLAVLGWLLFELFGRG